MEVKIKVILLLMCMMFLGGCSSSDVIEWNGEMEYYHVTMAHDETDMYVTAGDLDYIFIGNVEKVIKNVVDYDSKDHMDVYSRYSVKVEENLKGELAESIECFRHGGYLKDGTLLYPKSDSLENTRDIPQEGKKYIFMAYGQPDGSLILAEFFGDVEYTDESQKDAYVEYIQNEISVERERFLSKYDANYKQ